MTTKNYSLWLIQKLCRSWFCTNRGGTHVHIHSWPRCCGGSCFSSWYEPAVPRHANTSLLRKTCVRGKHHEHPFTDNKFLSNNSSWTKDCCESINLVAIVGRTGVFAIWLTAEWKPAGQNICCSVTVGMLLIQEPARCLEHIHILYTCAG